MNYVNDLERKDKRNFKFDNDLDKLFSMIPNN